MIRYGPEQLSNIELMAILLRTGYKDFTALDVSKSLFAKFGQGIANLSDASVEELKQVKGIGAGKATQIIAAMEFGKRISLSKEVRRKIKSPTDITDYLIGDMGRLKREHFRIVMLDNKNFIIEVHEVSIGSLNSAIVHPREVFKNAIRRSSASIILVHNHPSGNTEPSKEDIDITDRLVECGNLLGIKVLDHVIIGSNGYFSFKEESMI